MVIRLAGGSEVIYITDPELSWEVERDKMLVDLRWDILPNQVAGLPPMFPGAALSLSVVSYNGGDWEVVDHMVNGTYRVVQATVYRAMRNLTCDLSLRRWLV